MKVLSPTLGFCLLILVSFAPRSESLTSQEKSANQTLRAAPTLKLINVKSSSNGSIEFRVESPEQYKVLVQSSADLAEWTTEGLWLPNAPIIITNTSAPKTHRFYRATDFVLRIHGTVRDIQTDLPVGQAKVTLSDFSSSTQDVVTQTDDQGLFHAVISREHTIRKIAVEKIGYDLLVTEPLIFSDASNFHIPLWLAPPGHTPPNDDFQNRIPIEGTNLVIRTRTFAATSEAGHTLNILYVDYFQNHKRNLWWTWTAPTDGAVHIEMERPWVFGESGMAVYTGESLMQLTEVWDTGQYFWEDTHAVNPFFVKQGQQYHIALGTVWPAEAGFSLRMVTPVPPVAFIGYDASQMKAVGESLWLRARADGPWPVTFQWRKDGVDIQNSTNATFYRSSLVLEDAGAYSVRVANEAGATISDEINIIVLKERPTPEQVIQGTWKQETSQTSLLITFDGGEFITKRASDNSTVGSGRYSISQAENPSQYRLVMTYTEPLPEVARYFRVTLSTLDNGVYQEWEPNWTKPYYDEVGAFTRLSH